MVNEKVTHDENYPESETNPNLVDCMRDLILEKLKAGKDRTADNYLSALNKFCAFGGDNVDDLTLSDLTQELLRVYLLWLTNTEELAKGTVDFYMRTFKAMYNKVVREFDLHTTLGNPFVGTTVKVPPTRKRALPDAVFSRLISLDLTEKPHLLAALHLALFIFYARGMSFIDVFNLTNENIVDNYIVYIRSKTRVSLQVKITPEMRRLLRMYRKKNNPWIFPFLHENMNGGSGLSPRSSLRRINRSLKEIGGMLDLQQPLTTYVMRHSWASLMLEAGSELGVISQSLGHTSMHTTEIYLSNLSVGKIDKAADDMLNLYVRRKRFYREELLEELEGIDEETERQEVPVSISVPVKNQLPAVQEVVFRQQEVISSKLWSAISSVVSKVRFFRK